VACENAKAGTPMSDWYSPNSWGPIKGFGDHESVKPGDTLNFKVSSPASYKVQIYRLGWYGGDGARFMSSSPTTTFAAHTQPPCMSDPTGLVDCGNWSKTASWSVPSDAVSGEYLAYLDQTDDDGLMIFPFVVRDESSHSDLVVQSSDETWQAYNQFGGRNLYDGNGPAPDGRAYKVSYNRPLDVGGDNGVLASEYSMVAWLERNGYDVSYLSGIDVSTKGALLRNHKAFMSSGHDEYWNQAQWDNVQAAKQAGVNLAFFSGNEVFWRTRLEPSIDGTGTANRTLVCYKMTKMTLDDGIADPSGQWTGTWMDPNGAPTGGYQPQNQLTGTLFRANGYRNDAITVSAAYKNMRLWRNTSITGLTSGQVATFPTGTLGYEWDVDENNGFRPAGAIDLSSTTINITEGNFLLDNGNTYGNGVGTHSLVQYRDPVSHALVFGAGTVQWSWGLDTVHVGSATVEDKRMQQATVNLLADMGVRPATLQSGLVAAATSTDTTGPSVTITAPTSGATVPALSPVTITGTTSDAGGTVARVEVSVDGGTTWRAASGMNSWSYSWTPTVMGAATIKVRAIDDSSNTGVVTSRAVTIGAQQCPCTIFPNSVSPTTSGVDSGDFTPVELGVKFRTSAPGSATGVRFYKAALNTGTHLGRLWSSSGQLLASGTFAGETSTGWQTLTFSSPVPLRSNTTYIASYYAPAGHYSADGAYFNSQGAGLPPVQALKAGVDGPNGTYVYSAGGGFPNQSFNNTNYYVEPVVDTSQASTTPPSVTSVTPGNGSAGVAINAAVTASFNEEIDTATLQFTVTGPGGATVPGTVSYAGATHTATFTPSGDLALSTAYTSSARADDVWGNVMTSPHTWSFATSATMPPTNCPCTVWSSSVTPATQNAADFSSAELGTRFSSAIDGWVTGVKFYKGSQNTGTHTGTLWSDTGTQLATGTFTGETASGWQTLTFATPVAVTANTSYVVSYHAPNGNYSVDGGYFASPHQSYPLTAPADSAPDHNGLYLYGASAFPTNSYNASNYWVDALFTDAPPPGGDGPAAVASSAVAAKVSKISGTSVTFAAPIKPVGLTMRVRATTAAAEASEHTPVAGTVAYDAKTRTATFKPAGPLVPLATYEVTVRATGADGKQLKPVVWTVTAPKLILGKHKRDLPRNTPGGPSATVPDRMRQPRRIISLVPPK
jgi:hypothetical protein